MVSSWNHLVVLAGIIALAKGEDDQRPKYNDVD